MNSNNGIFGSRTRRSLPGIVGFLALALVSFRLMQMLLGPPGM